MASLGAIIALMPLALGIGTGAQMHQPLSIAVIGGFLAALPLYVVATGTGILRMYNNKHWLGDVAAGAGVGILSTTLSYWLYDKFHIGKNEKHQAFIFPGYNNKQFTIGLIKQF